MITVGLIKEIFFIAKSLNSSFRVSIQSENNGNTVWADVNPNGLLTVTYQGHILLKENIIEETSFFGVESVDSVSRAIACLNNNSENWKDYVYIDKTASVVE